MLKEYQVKQFVATVTNKSGTFNVYETGNPQYYLFRPVHNGCEGTIDVPVKKTDLKPNVSRALAHGASIDVRQSPIH